VITQELQAFIRQQFAAGVSKESLRATLFANDWSPQDVEDAFFAYSASLAPQSPPPLPSTPSGPVAPVPTLQAALQAAVAPIQPPIVAQAPQAQAASATVAKGSSMKWVFVAVTGMIVLGLAGAFFAFRSSSPAPVQSDQSAVSNTPDVTLPVASTSDDVVTSPDGTSTNLPAATSTGSSF
jgi:hypothetical protein